MFSRFAKLLLVGTAFAPVLCTYAFVLALTGRFTPWGWSALSVAVLLLFVCWLVLKAATRLERVPLDIDAVRTADSEIIGYVLAYLLPFVGLDTEKMRAGVLWFVFFLFLVMGWHTHSYHCNPLLGFLGYHFYEVSDTRGVTYVVITRKTMLRTRDVSTVVQLTEYMVLDAGES